MPDVSLIPVSIYQEVQWTGLVDDMRGLIAEGLDGLPHFVEHHARKRGLSYVEARAALIEAKETSRATA